ncbi:MAG: glycoside hydrolase family 113 [Flavobacteriales bacterium]
MVFIFFILLQSCIGQSQKINGISLVASGKPLYQKNIHPIKEVHANYASVMPFGFIKNINHPDIRFNTNRQWFGETNEGVKQYIALLQKNNIQIMLKPQIWIWNGEYTGLLKMTSENHWNELEQSYEKFILNYATIAQETQCEIFCIGTELEKFIAHRPQYWHELITKIRSIYSGKLTYAANWDEYKRVPFWKAVDFIGIDAYFPISESKTPTLSEAKQGWQAWIAEMNQISQNNKTPILFAEYGYRSIDYGGKEPWATHRNEEGINLETQSVLLKALYEEVWNKNWFAGGFIWKWFGDHPQVGGENNNRFTPQNKPAQELIKQHYKNAN